MLPSGVSPDDFRRTSPDASWLKAQTWLATPPPPPPRFLAEETKEAPVVFAAAAAAADDCAAAEAAAAARARRRYLGVGVVVAALLLAGGATAPGMLASGPVFSGLRGAAPSNATTTVLLLRHCDKDDRSATHCSPRGFRRAAWLQTQFGDGARFPKPARLYARKPEGKKRVLRSVETLRPTAKKLELKIDCEYGVETEKRLAGLLREDIAAGRLSDELVVIAWKHEQLPDLAKDLGWTTTSKARTKWKDGDFDSFYELTFSRSSATGAWRVVGERGAEGFVDDADDDAPTTATSTSTTAAAAATAP
mmetsp:Transcript_10341/g.31863  ORF Transcript_10341/g.31863 Transcript_10341/m.31863 type:complete len:307 (-) Transcript_10341:11-931(-)